MWINRRAREFVVLCETWWFRWELTTFCESHCFRDTNYSFVMYVFIWSSVLYASGSLHIYRVKNRARTHTRARQCLRKKTGSPVRWNTRVASMRTASDRAWMEPRRHVLQRVPIVPMPRHAIVPISRGHSRSYRSHTTRKSNDDDGSRHTHCNCFLVPSNKTQQF